MTKAKSILQVEDDENDILFLGIAMRKAGVDASCYVVRDGREAINYLSGVGKYADRDQFPIPCLVLVDLRLPKLPGHEVIRWIRQTPALDSVLVIVLTSSSASSDIKRAYQVGANSYLVKPTNPLELIGFATLIRDYWLKGKQPPPGSGHLCLDPDSEVVRM